MSIERMEWSKMRKTHSARPVPMSYAKRDRLPDFTPVVGDRIRYLTVTGIEVWPLGVEIDALAE